MPITVNGEQIDGSAIEQEMEHLRPDYERTFAGMDEKERESQLLEWSKENLIERTLMTQQANKKKYPVTDKDVQNQIHEIQKEHKNSDSDFNNLPKEQQQKIKEQIKQQLKIQRLTDEICADLSEPTDNQVADFYKENIDNFSKPEQIRVAHMVKHPNSQMTDADAKALLQDIKSRIDGGELFEILVEEHSDCPDSSGDLGYFARGQMVEEFEDIVFNLDINQVSDVFHSRFGYHIAKLYDRKAKQIIPLEEVKSKIVEILTQQHQTKRIEDYLDQLKSTADIRHE